MIRKTQKIYKRRARNHAGRQTAEERTWFGGSHTEVVTRTTWWLLWVVPMYVRETVVGHDLTL